MLFNNLRLVVTFSLLYHNLFYCLNVSRLTSNNDSNVWFMTVYVSLSLRYFVPSVILIWISIKGIESVGVLRVLFKNLINFGDVALKVKPNLYSGCLTKLYNKQMFLKYMSCINYKGPGGWDDTENTNLMLV